MNISAYIYNIGKVIALMAVAVGMGACQDRHDPYFIDNDTYGGNPGNRVPAVNDRRVVLMYQAGYNSLSDCLRDDLNDVIEGWLPEGKKKDNVLLVYTHQPARDGQYNVRTTPYLLRLSDLEWVS